MLVYGFVTLFAATRISLIRSIKWILRTFRAADETRLSYLSLLVLGASHLSLLVLGASGGGRNKAIVFKLVSIRSFERWTK
jgi:hypothetical protein